MCKHAVSFHCEEVEQSIGAAQKHLPLSEETPHEGADAAAQKQVAPSEEIPEQGADEPQRSPVRDMQHERPSPSPGPAATQRGPREMVVVAKHLKVREGYTLTSRLRGTLFHGTRVRALETYVLGNGMVRMRVAEAPSTASAEDDPSARGGFVYGWVTARKSRLGNALLREAQPASEPAIPHSHRSIAPSARDLIRTLSPKRRLRFGWLGDGATPALPPSFFSSVAPATGVAGQVNVPPSAWLQHHLARGAAEGSTGTGTGLPSWMHHPSEQPNAPAARRRAIQGMVVLGASDSPARGAGGQQDAAQQQPHARACEARKGAAGAHHGSSGAGAAVGAGAPADRSRRHEVHGRGLAPSSRHPSKAEHATRAAAPSAASTTTSAAGGGGAPPGDTCEAWLRILQPASWYASAAERMRASAETVVAELAQHEGIDVLVGRALDERGLGKGAASDRATLQKLMAEWDPNRDGSISRMEFRHNVRSLLRDPKLDSRKCDALFESLDRDGSGALDLDELRVGRRSRAEATAATQQPQHTERICTLCTLYARADTD